METKQTSCFGIDVEFQVPSTAEEYNQMCTDREGDSCLDDAISYTLFHSTLGQLRKAFVEAVEKETGIAPRTRVTGKNKAGNDIVEREESDAAYFARVCSETETEDSDYTTMMQSCADKVKFDPNTAPRSTGPKEVAKTYKKTAEAFFKDPETSGKVQAICAKLLELNPKVKLADEDKDENGEFTPSALARLISANEARKRAAASLKKTVLADVEA